MPRKPMDLAARFWPRVDRVSSHSKGCHEFDPKARRPLPDNYGRFKWKNPITGKSESVNASRVAFYLANGHLPLVACHTCDNPPCCRPDHIYDGTHQTNGADKAHRGRGRGKVNQQGEANDFAVLTDAIVLDARRRARAGETQKAIASLHGVSRDALGYAVRGQTWSHLDEIEPPVTGRRGGTRLTEDDIREIRRSAERPAEIAARYGITPSNITAIRNRKSWKHVV